MKIAISAAETSGDLIGAALVKSLIELNPDCQIEGLAGEMMSGEGCHRLWNMDHANVMGFSEVIKKLPSLLKLRSSIVTHYTNVKTRRFYWRRFTRFLILKSNESLNKWHKNCSLYQSIGMGMAFESYYKN